MAYSIVILSRNVGNLRACLVGIRKNQPNARVIVVDDGLGDWPQSRINLESYVDGEKPFIFSRNANIGIRAAGDDDVILCNDDAVLMTIDGFSWLHQAAVGYPEYGILSSSIHGFVGNPEQKHWVSGSGYIQRSDNIRPITGHTVAFICVHLPRTLINELGPLDERLIHYGWEDNLYCLQARARGYKLGVYDGCVVEHGTLPSTYRDSGQPVNNGNQEIFESIVKEKDLESFL